MCGTSVKHNIIILAFTVVARALRACSTKHFYSIAGAALGASTNSREPASAHNESHNMFQDSDNNDVDREDDDDSSSTGTDHVDSNTNPQRPS